MGSRTPPLVPEAHYRMDHAVVVQLEPGRTVVLENRGAFVVQPLGENSSRLHVRTRGSGTPSLAGVALGPVSLLACEPAHFIMERRMLLGIATGRGADPACRVFTAIGVRQAAGDFRGALTDRAPLHA